MRTLVMLGRGAALSLALASLSVIAHGQKIAHEADLTYSNAQCTTTAPCNLQVYRAQCASSTVCPSFAISPTSFAALPAATVAGTATITAAVTAGGTTWTYVDTDATLKDAVTYVWVATDAFQSSPSAASGPSNPFQGTTLGPPNAPLSSGKVVR